MSTKQLPVDLEHAIWYCAHASLSGFTPDDDARKASDAIRAEHAQRVTMQHHVADLEAERDRLRARLDEIEAQAMPTGERQAVLLTDDEMWDAVQSADPDSRIDAGRLAEEAALAKNGLEVPRG